eukprot:4295535-Amphidinium_carterae.3
MLAERTDMPHVLQLELWQVKSNPDADGAAVEIEVAEAQSTNHPVFSGRVVRFKGDLFEEHGDF